ncbi:3-dehydrosphinganine reductase TSC10A-like [Durio zibethinus]|uniref:3-dehydrosphinganine reductase n=1 Tax=Durio zibethinus TaxID=66656 RepID=A0A6P5YN25_DURZI|nr:3-dehydrosphinganine reductase TSC10A-like [Durio zibethinus]
MIFVSYYIFRNILNYQPNSSLISYNLNIFVVNYKCSSLVPTKASNRSRLTKPKCKEFMIKQICLLMIERWAWVYNSTKTTTFKTVFSSRPKTIRLTTSSNVKVKRNTKTKLKTIFHETLSDSSNRRHRITAINAAHPFNSAPRPSPPPLLHRPPRPVTIPIKNRHVFITGGSSGIGLALAHQVASQGARVSLLARSLNKLEEAKESIRLSSGVDVLIFSADVRDYDAVHRAVNDAGPIDVLVVNQGVFVPQELEKQGLDEVRFMIDVNLMGSFNVIKAALPLMKERKDRRPTSIALISSQAGQVGIYGYTAYSATKFGLRGLAEALQQEVIADNIHVSVIFPPDTDTPGLEQENKVRPELTKILAGSSGSMKADEVAKKALDGIKSGSFIVPCNFEGHMLAIATSGLSPQRSFLMAFVEVVFAGILRLIALFFQWNWYGSIEQWHAKRKET